MKYVHIKVYKALSYSLEPNELPYVKYVTNQPYLYY